MTLLDQLSRRVASFADEERMFRRAKKVLVAASGGADSTAALILLQRLGRERGFEVVACHFDHMVRESSRQDLETTRAICGQLGIECFTGEGDVRGVAAQQRKGLEEVARTMRYQFLAFVAGKELADGIATGHTADDQAETVLMRIIRGSGVRGIRGMLPVSGVPGAEAQRLLRPLLQLTRAETSDLCEEAGIVPVVDPSNDDPVFTRNRIRHQTMAGLRMVNPSARGALLGLAESARQLFEPVEKQVLALAPKERGPIGAIFGRGEVGMLPAEGLTLLVERESAFYHLVPEVNRTRVTNLRSVLERGTGRVSFGDAEVEVSTGLVRVGPRLESVEPFESTVLNVPGSTRVGPWRVDVAMSAFVGESGSGVLACEIVGQRGALRARLLQPGDRMVFRGMTRKVSDLLAMERIPTWERVGVVAIADSEVVHGLIGATRSIAAAGGSEEDDLHFRLTALPAR